MKKGNEIRERLHAISNPLDLTQGLFEHSPVPYSVFQADGRCLLVNPAYLSMFGRGPPPEYNLLEDEVARKLGLSDLILRAFQGEVVRTPVTWYDPKEMEHVRVTDVKRVAISCTAFPMRDARGEVMHVAIAYKDVTAELLARQEVERLYHEAKEAIRLRDEFLAIASHELKTPLTPLQLEVDTIARRAPGLMKDQASRSWLEKHVQQIQRQSRRLQRFIDDLLDVSRITGGRLHLMPEPVELASLVREVVGGFVAEGNAARLGSSIEVRAPAPVRGTWDRMRLEQVVSNLVTNALKYGAGKPVDVEVASAGGQARIVVTDQGIGVAPEAQERIFGRFEREAAARHYGGLGLGLYIARQFVEAMGGSIAVRSAPGQGAQFTVLLPMGAWYPPAPCDGSS